MFSIVITTKDRQEFLLRCLKTILKNSILPREIIVVNDGGKTPDFSSIDFKKVDFQLLSNLESKGANYSRNLGVLKSSADIVFLLDDDDALNEYSLKRRLDILMSDPSVGLVYTGIKIVASNNLDMVLREVKPVSSKNVHFDLLSKGNIIGSTSRVALRKHIFIKAGKFDEKLSCLQDYDLWIRISKISKVAHDFGCNVLYTIHNNGNQISSNYDKYICAGKYLLNKYNEDITSYGLYNKFKSQLYLRCALSSKKYCYKTTLIYSLKSFFCKPNIKALTLIFLPKIVLNKLYPFT
ncbi:glycosyltransferase family 2 protein [Shewanella sp. 4_MG-2023]|uniref:glycosyltransferase family 2 protein n=1 Tax=Shewanella sp. 4_MG-2023 TaxID=3062652 RepID=UPI0026E2089B|nr:glycosyltransferase family A protein [Shewanella sp. 4_MG-2023]MDO6678457.1 glycosyltransferase family A protein [Shewanella sp. 4_MG-2023]